MTDDMWGRGISGSAVTMSSRVSPFQFGCMWPIAFPKHSCPKISVIGFGGLLSRWYEKVFHFPIYLIIIIIIIIIIIKNLSTFSGWGSGLSALSFEDSRNHTRTQENVSREAHGKEEEVERVTELRNGTPGTGGVGS